MDKHARVLYITHLFVLTFSEVGLNSYNAAIRIGTDVLVITRKLPEPLVQMPSSIRIQQISYPDSHLQLIKNNKILRVLGFAQSLVGQLWLAIKSINPARSYCPDIIHSFGALTLPAAYMVRLVTGAPVVVSLHGTDFHRTNRSSFLVRWVGMADAIVCVSQHMVIALQEKLPDKPIYYCPSGVDLTIFKKDPSLQRENIILCVGRLTSVKRYDLILETFARVIQKLPQFRLVIMGRGGLLPELEEKARILGIFDRVTFGGVVEKIELSGIMQRAKLFLMASDWEGTPKALLEAMACGVPVVSSDVGDCAYLAQGAGKIAKDHSVDSLATAALEVLSDGKWEEYSQQAVQNATQFDWPQVTHKLREVYSVLKPGVFCE